MENKEALLLVVGVLNRAAVSQLEKHGLQAAITQLDKLVSQAEAEKVSKVPQNDAPIVEFPGK